MRCLNLELGMVTVHDGTGKKDRSFASHLLQANYDIRTIRELLGHSDVRTIMIYTHTVKSRTIKEV